MAIDSSNDIREITSKENEDNGSDSFEECVNKNGNEDTPTDYSHENENEDITTHSHENENEDSSITDSFEECVNKNENEDTPPTHSHKKSEAENENGNIDKEIVSVPANDDHQQSEIEAPTQQKTRGGWKLAFILLVNQGLATLAFFGVGVNLVLFLTRVLRQENAIAANNVSVWTGTVYLFSLAGAFLSDSYWGRYLTCTVFQLILLAGLMLLSLTSWYLLVKPRGCGDGKLQCYETSKEGVILFYLSIYLVAVGYGGHQPTIATFGSDQFDETTKKGSASKEVFFGYFYFALNCGMLFSNTLLVYFEDNGHWTIGFWLSTSAAVLGLVLFLGGSHRYRYVMAHGNPLPRIAQVFVAAYRKWNVESGAENELYEVEGNESAIKGSRKIVHTDNFRFLDKAATREGTDPREANNPWRLCTITQVEEAKCVLKMMPIWLCTIIYSVIFTQMASLFVEQGDVMDTKIGTFNIPAASMSLFDIGSVLICTGLYRHLLVPLASKLTNNPKGLTELQRMGVGLVIGMFSMVAAGVSEIARLSNVNPGKKSSDLSVLWQIPQYVLVGCSEVFMYVGQLDFFNGQAPDGIKSFGSSLCMASISFGNYVSCFMVHVVMRVTSSSDQPGWIPSDLNEGHVERFYFMIMVLTAIDVVIYVFCARWYKPVIFINTGSQPQAEEMEGQSTITNDDRAIRSV